MPLQRTSKSFPFGGGIHEDAPQELIEPPGNLVVQNCRFNKQDSIEKALPINFFPGPTVTGQPTDISNDPSKPPFIFGDDKFLVAGGNEEFAYWNAKEEAWVNRSIPFDILGLDHKFTTKGAANASRFTWAPIGAISESGEKYVIVGYAVAFEAPTFNTVEHGSTVLQVYSAEGQLLAEQVYQGYTGPQLQPLNGSSGGGRAAALYCVYEDDGVIYYGYISISAAGVVTVPEGVGQLVSNTVSTVMNNQNADTTNKTFDNYYPEQLRMTHARSWKDKVTQLRYYQNYNDDSGGAFVYKDLSTMIIYAQATRGTTGTATGSPIALSLDDMLERHSFLDVHVYGAYIYVLLARCVVDKATFESQAYVRRIHRSTFAVSTALNLSGAAIDGVITRGSLVAKNATNDIAWAYSYVPGHPSDWGQPGVAGGAQAATKQGTALFSPDSYDVECTQYNTTLCSNLVWSDSTNDAYAVLEQFSEMTPGRYDADAIAADSGTITPTLSKAVTPTLCRFRNDEQVDWPGRVVPVGVFDAAQSKTNDYSCHELTIHLNNLYHYHSIKGLDAEDEDEYRYQQFWFGNRYLVAPEQNFVFVSQLSDEETSSYDADYSKRALAPGTGKMNLYVARPDGQFTSAQLQGGCLITGALPLWFDGNTLTEAMPLDQPEITFANCADGTGIYWTAYQVLDRDETPMVFQAVVGFYDSSGLMHRSAPSFPLYLGGLMLDSNTSVEVDLRVTIPMSTQIDSGLYFVEIYTGTVGNSLQLAASEPLPQTTFSSQDVRVRFKFAKTDLDGTVSDIPSASAFVYTTGSVLAADPWPACLAVAETSSRLFGITKGDAGIIVFTKLFEAGLAPEFNASLNISLGLGRKATAIANIDDKVIVFETDRINVLYGDGPDNTGANGYFSVEPIQSTVGCVSQDSIVSVPDGVIFFSGQTKTFHMVTRDLQVVEVGRPVTSLCSEAAVVSSVRDTEQHEAIFFMTDIGLTYPTGRDPTESDVNRPPRAIFGQPKVAYGALVYNYEYQKWSIRTGLAANTIWRKTCNYRGVPHGIANTFYVYNIARETDTMWSYSKLPKIETPWIKLNQLQNYGGVLGVTILGRYLSDWRENVSGRFEAGDLRVTIRYDYEGEDGREDVFIWRANVDLNETARHSLQIQCRPGRRKCQAIRLIIEEVATTKLESFEPTYSTGRGFQLLGADIEYGLKSFGVKQGPKSRRK
jgi:hypothetical protein